MSVRDLVLLFLACGAFTFPVTLTAVRYAASWFPDGRLSRRIGGVFETALSLSVVIWMVGALVFYVVALHIERQKPCDQQHTNQLTHYCRILLGARD